MRVRRRTLVLIAAGITLVLGGFVAAGVGWLLKSERGRDIVSARIERMIRGKFHGKSVHIGHVSGNVLESPTLDSLEIRDTDDSVMVASGPITFHYDLIDLWDSRIALKNVSVKRLFVHLRQDSVGTWNFRKVLGPSGPATPSTPGIRFGDVVVIDTLTISDAAFRWTQPWSPRDRLRSAQRDSSIRYNLARTDAKIQRDGPRFIRVRDWTNIQAVVPHARLKQPGTEGIALDIAKLDFDEFDPPFVLRDVRGRIAVARDTVTLDIAALRLPGSSGRASGIISGKDGLMVAVRVIADSMSMSDIAWIYPTLPTEGGGRLTLDIRKQQTSDVTDYALSQMDVSTTKSRLTGAMTFGVGNPLLSVTDVNLDLLPVDLKLFEQFGGGVPFPLPWAGQLRGKVIGRGGPVDNFRVDSMAIEFTDANVAGVVNRFHGNGALDIVYPALPVFYDFALGVDRFDFRTARAVSDKFAPLVGWISGSARLDSVWTDVRFRDGDVRYVVDSAPDSRFTGSGRVITGVTEMTYDLVMNANPISLDAMARSYPKLTLRGAFSGPFTVQGTLADLAVVGDVTGEGGRVQADVRVDELPPGYGATGTVTLTGIDPSRVLVNAADWKGQLDATIEAALRGDSLANLEGGANVTFRRSDLGPFRVYRGRTVLNFTDGLVRADTLTVQSSIGEIFGAGALGLRAGRTDSLTFTVAVDSLGGLRPWLSPLVDSLPPDSLAGSFTGSGRLAGSIDSLDLRFEMTGRNLVYGATTARRMTANADIRDLLKRRVGTAAFVADSGTLGGVRLARFTADARLTGGDSARVTTHAVSMTGPVMDAAGNVDVDSLAFRARVDSLRMIVGGHDWRLVRPAGLTFARDSTTIENLDLSSGTIATFSLNGSLPRSGPVRGTLAANAFPLGDLGQILQVPIPLGGDAALRVDLGGTRAAPTLDIEMKAQDAKLGETRVEGLTSKGRYADRLLTATVDYKSKGVTVLSGEAHLPVDLALRKVRKRLLDEPLRGSITADSADLAVIETFANVFKDATGRLDTRLTLGGTWQQPRLNGTLRVMNGAFGLTDLGVTRYQNVYAFLGFAGDMITIDTLSARSGPDLVDIATVRGYVKIPDLDDPQFDLTFRAADFHVVEKAGVASLQLTTAPATPLRLVGSKSASRLTGRVTIGGDIFIPDVGKKTVFPLDDPEFYRLADSTVLSNRRLLPSPPPAIVENMALSLGINANDNLWLRSAEANVNLVGALDVTTTTVVRLDGRVQRRFALDGTLNAQRGTYELNLGLLRRSFVVESGTLRFDAETDLDPTVNISALYTVRQTGRVAQKDVRVRVNIAGTLSSLTLGLSSADGLRLSNADLLSYLVTGAPSFDIGGRATDYGTTAARIGVSSFASYFGNRFSPSWCDVFDVSTAGLEGGYGNVRQSSGDVLSNTRLGCGKQLPWDTFVHVDFGLCGLGQGSVDPVSLGNSVGVKLDKRLGNALSASFGLDPATSATLCAQGAGVRGFVPTPRGFGLDFFRSWRY